MVELGHRDSCTTDQQQSTEHFVLRTFKMQSNGVSVSKHPSASCSSGDACTHTCTRTCALTRMHTHVLTPTHSHSIKQHTCYTIWASQIPKV